MDDLTVTNDSMKNFVEENGLMVASIRAWLWERAELLDWKSMSHFQQLVSRLASEAILLAQQELKMRQKPSH